MSRSKRQRPRLHPRLLPHPAARPPAVALAESYTWAWNVTFRVSSAVSTVLWGIDPNPRPVGVLLQGLPVALRIDPGRYRVLHVSPSHAPPLF